MFGKQTFGGPSRNNGTQKEIFTDFVNLLPITSSSDYAMLIHGDSSLPGADPLSKFFWAVRRKVKGSS